MPYFNEKNWRLECSGWHITDCAVRDRNILYLCLREALDHEKASMLMDHDIRVNLISLYLDTPDEQYSGQELIGMNKPRVGVRRGHPAQGLLAARNRDGDVWVVGGGSEGHKEYIDPGHWPSTYRLKCVLGSTWSVGGGRSIYRRSAPGQWIKLDAGLPDEEANAAQGFDDLDGFDANDLYAVGGHGDVWHYDGARWQRQGFPSNVRLATVTCAPNGKVFITGEGGTLWEGRHSTWKCLYQGASSVLWNDVLWFEGQLWLASDYQLRIWNGKELVSPQWQGQSVPIWGHMDAADGLLIVASPSDVWSFDGKRWEVVVAPYAG